MPRIILLTALAALCLTACRTSGDVANSQPTPTTNVATNKENATPTVEAVAAGGASAPADPEPSLMSLSAGAIVVKKPQEYGSTWSAIWILDEKPKSGWATPKNVTRPQVIVIALPEQSRLDKLVFDTGGVDGADGRGAKDILVEVSDTNADEGYRKIAELSLQDKSDRQPVEIETRVEDDDRRAYRRAGQRRVQPGISGPSRPRRRATCCYARRMRSRLAGRSPSRRRISPRFRPKGSTSKRNIAARR